MEKAAGLTCRFFDFIENSASRGLLIFKKGNS
jgi:hypothetical protein